MAQYTDDTQQPASPPNGVQKGKEDRSKATRHPRWTREETLVLIEGKKVVENQAQAQEDRKSTLAFRQSGQITTKWDSISSYCHRHGVNRGPFQCQKRWGNLICEFRKIKTWESQKMEKDESFWIMRNERRKEKKLPGSFDREVYNVMEGRLFAIRAIPLALITVKEEMNTYNEGQSSAAEKAAENLEEEGNAEFGHYKQTGPEDSSFMNVEHPRRENLSSEEITKTENPSNKQATPMLNAGKIGRKIPGFDTWTGANSKEKCKRKRISLDGYVETDNDLEDQLINVLKENIKMLSAQIQAENINYEQDRNQRKDQNDSLIRVLNKLTDAVVKIADKLSATS